MLRFAQHDILLIWPIVTPDRKVAKGAFEFFGLFRISSFGFRILIFIRCSAANF
jgi:hypothetical protein